MSVFQVRSVFPAHWLDMCCPTHETDRDRFGDVSPPQNALSPGRVLGSFERSASKCEALGGANKNFLNTFHVLSLVAR